MDPRLSVRLTIVLIGYQVSYFSDGNVVQLITQHHPQVGNKVKLTEPEADQATTPQQQQLIQIN